VEKLVMVKLGGGFRILHDPELRVVSLRERMRAFAMRLKHRLNRKLKTWREDR